MTEFRVKKWIAFWLALALMLPMASALGEEALPNDALMTVESSPAEETVSEAISSAVSDPAPDDEQSDDAEEQSPSEEQGSQQDATQSDSTSEEHDQQETTPVRLAESSLSLGVKEKRNLTLSGDVSPESVGAVFTSSNSKVVSVNRTTGAVTGKKKGKATVTMQTADGEVSTCDVCVKKAPSSVKLSSSNLTLGVGEDAVLKATLSSNSASAIRFSSSNKKVVGVDGAGNLHALKSGTAKITAKTFNGKKYVCKVTVEKAPTSVAFSSDSATLLEGDSYTASVRLTRNSREKYVLTSDDETVVTVKGNKLKGVGVGTTVVTVTTYNGLTATMSVEVCRRPVYRALLIGESTFPYTRYVDLPAKKDVSLMNSMLGSAQGPAKAKWSVTTRTNRTASQIHDDIQYAFSGAQEGDVSLFYISTHGDQEVSINGDTPEYAGYLVTYPDDSFVNYYDQKTLTLPCLASWLKEVPGQVIVIIDSCGSGAAIYGAKSNGSAESSAGAAFSPGAFDGAVVNAFESEDSGTVVQTMEEGAFVLENKFYVLTSAGYQEACWTNNGKYSYFTKWLTDGIGTKGRMPADSNKDGQTTLKEIYNYVKKRGEKTKITDSKGAKCMQHVQVYPANSGFELFYRK